MFLFRTKQNAQRKYVDLIKEAAAKWPNWDPPRNIRPGDFGTVNKKTGELVVEGNIYTHADIMGIASQHPPVQAAEVDQYSIHSYEVQALNINAEAGLEIPTAQGVVFESRWQFSSRRGAILLMHLPRLTHVPDEFFNEETLKHPVLRGKCVVNQVWNCPGYYMYLSSRSRERVAVSLRTNVTIPAGPGVSANPGVGVSWVAKGCTGVRQHAYRPDPVYTPLFCLRSIRKPLFRRDESELGEEAWHETDVPWDDLDDEGLTEPEPEYDNGPDDDDDDDEDD